MKVLIISTNVFPIPLQGYGGQEVMVYNLAVGLNDRHHAVTVVAPAVSNLPEPIELIATEVNEDEEKSLARYQQRLEEFDVIVDSSWQKWATMAGAGRDPQLPVINWHCTDPSVYQMPAPVKYPMWVGVSRNHAERIGRAYGCQAKYVLNGIDTQYYQANGALRKGFLWIARWMPEKGPAEVIEVAQRLKIHLDMYGDRQIIGSQSYADMCFNKADGIYAKANPGISREATVNEYSRHQALLQWYNWEEPFGLNVGEAMTCFPATTHIGANSIVNVHKRSYSGCLITIETDKGTVEATAEHPFWTNKGWVKAKNLNDTLYLLYDGKYEEQSVYTGRIGEIVRTLQSKYNTVRDSRRNGSFSFINKEASSEIRIEEESLIPDNGRNKNIESSISKYKNSRFSEPIGMVNTVYKVPVGKTRVQKNSVPYFLSRRGQQNSAAISDTYYPVCSRYTEEEIICCSMASSQFALEKDLCAEDILEKIQHFCNRFSLSCWDNRWRGNCYYPENERTQNKACCSDIEYLNFINRLAVKKNKVSGGICWQEHNEGGVYFLHNWSDFCPPFPIHFTVLNNKTPTHGINDRMDNDSFISNSERRFDAEASRNCPDITGFEYQAVKKVSSQYVTNFPVFNLTTVSNTYKAEGFLVHNCGCIPVVARRGAMPELIINGKTGFLCNTLDEMIQVIKEDRIKEIDLEAMRKHVEDNFGLTAYTDRWESLLQEVATGLRW